MPQVIYQVDAFTSQPFRGNPAGVCILDHEPEVQWMQNVAMEMNLSETAFVFPEKGKRIIRFYSPEAEIDLCGHATLSASHILYESGIVKNSEELIFSSKAGILKVMKNGAWITMNFPIYTLERIKIPGEFIRLTGIEPLELYRCGNGWSLALLGSDNDVRKMSPDFAGMKNSEFGDLIVTSPSSDPAYDFCVRCFVPALGINEDPVTGSANCVLVPFWSIRTGKTEFVSHQLSKREGVLRTALRDNRVEISGEAKTILKAEMYV